MTIEVEKAEGKDNFILTVKDDERIVYIFKTEKSEVREIIGVLDNAIHH